MNAWSTTGPSVTVTTTDGAFTDTRVVTVTQLVTGVTLDIDTLTMEVGQTAQLTAAVTPANASNKTLEWGSSNDAYATLVGNPGNVTGTVTAVAATAGLPG